MKKFINGAWSLTQFLTGRKVTSHTTIFREEVTKKKKDDYQKHFEHLDWIDKEFHERYE